MKKYAALLGLLFFSCIVSAQNVQPINIPDQGVTHNFSWANVTVWNNSALVSGGVFFWENFTFTSTNSKSLNLGVVKPLPSGYPYNQIFNYSVEASNGTLYWLNLNNTLGYLGRPDLGGSVSSTPYWVSVSGNTTSNMSINGGNVHVSGAYVNGTLRVNDSVKFNNDLTIGNVVAGQGSTYVYNSAGNLLPTFQMTKGGYGCPTFQIQVDNAGVAHISAGCGSGITVDSAMSFNQVVAHSAMMFPMVNFGGFYGLSDSGGSFNLGVDNFGAGNPLIDLYGTGVKTFHTNLNVVSDQNLTATKYLFGNGTYITDLPGTTPYWITNNSYTTSNISINSGNVNVTGNLSANTVSMRGSYISFVNVTSNYKATAFDDVISANGTFTVTLPSSVGQLGRVYSVKNWNMTAGQGVVYVNCTNNEKIDGALNYTIRTTGSGARFISDGGNWEVMGVF